MQFRRKKKPVTQRSNEGEPIHERLYGTAVGMDAEARKRAREKREQQEMTDVTFKPLLSKTTRKMNRSRTREAAIEELAAARQRMPKDHKSRDASFGVSKTLKPGPAALMGTTPRFTPFAGATRPKAFALDGSHRPVTPKKSPRKRPPEAEEPEPEPEPQALFLQEAMDRLGQGLVSKRHAREAFRKLDKDNSGEIAAQELKTALKHMSLHLDDQQVELVVSHLDKDGDGVISEWEFLGVVWANKLKTVRRKMQACAYAEGGVDLEKLFRHYDRDNSGELGFEEFKNAIRKDVGMKESDATDGEIKEIFKHLDNDSSGTIGFAEFRTLLAQPRGGVNVARFESSPGQVFNKILEHADAKKMNIMNLFHRFDADDSGGLERGEFQLAMKALQIKLSKDELQQVMDEMDRDGDGALLCLSFM